MGLCELQASPLTDWHRRVCGAQPDAEGGLQTSSERATLHLLHHLLCKLYAICKIIQKIETEKNLQENGELHPVASHASLHACSLQAIVHGIA